MGRRSRGLPSLSPAPASYQSLCAGSARTAVVVVRGWGWAPRTIAFVQSIVMSNASGLKSCFLGRPTGSKNPTSHLPLLHGGGSSTVRRREVAAYAAATSKFLLRSARRAHSPSSERRSVRRRSSEPDSAGSGQLVAEKPKTREGTGTPCRCTIIVAAEFSLAGCRCVSIAPFLSRGPIRLDRSVDRCRRLGPDLDDRTPVKSSTGFGHRRRPTFCGPSRDPTTQVPGGCTPHGEVRRTLLIRARR